MKRSSYIFFFAFWTLGFGFLYRFDIFCVNYCKEGVGKLVDIYFWRLAIFREVIESHIKSNPRISTDAFQNCRILRF